jgi:hypothetical protein
MQMRHTITPIHLLSAFHAKIQMGSAWLLDTWVLWREYYTAARSAFTLEFDFSRIDLFTRRNS